MPLSDVLSKLRFYGTDLTWPTGSVVAFSDPGDENRIRSIITQLYNGSTYAANILDDAAAKGLILIGETPGDEPGASISNPAVEYLGFNLNAIDSLYYFNQHGQLVGEIRALTIIHEFSHYARNTDDPDPDFAAMNSGPFDFMGGAVADQNQVAIDLGHVANIQPSYHASLSEGEPDDDVRLTQIQLGFSYSKSEIVDVVRLGFDDEDDVLDMSNGHPTRDLLMGFGGADVMDGGQNRDFLYGQGDDDLLWGGSGADFIDGGSGQDSVDVALMTILSNASYSIRGLAPSGEEVRAGVELTNLSDSSDVDHLFDVESLKLTDGNDIIKLAGDLSVFGNLDFIVDLRLSDVGFGQDVVDASGLHTGVYVNLGSGGIRGMDQTADLGYFGLLARLMAISFTPNDLYIVNGNEAKGTQYSDILRASSGEIANGLGYSALYGMGGNDLLIGAGWESHLFGGEGDDRFEIGASTWIEDAEIHDAVSYYGIPIFGGTKQWWMEGNTAYWSPFSTLVSAFPVIGASLLQAAASLLDVPMMKFAAFQHDGDGNLVMRLGWGHGGLGVIRDYQLDLDSGEASAGVVVFQTDDGGEAADFEQPDVRFTKYVNLALKAGFGVGLYGFDPLVLDLDSDGYELTTRTNSRTYFEFDADGFGERTGWVRSDDGLLSLDLNSNGKIDNVTELFGNQTTSGFTMLAAHDLNSDGIINSSDAVFANLRVWRDFDQDGITDTGELKTLAELGITAISLSSVAPAEPTAIGGNQIVRTGTFTRADGSTGNLADVAFQINETASRWLGDTTVSSAAAALPQLRGFGELKDLRIAMTGDSTLLDMVGDFVASTSNDLAALKAGAEAILYKWAGVDGVTATAIGSNGLDARKLAFLEQYSGYALMPRDTGGAVLTTNLAEMEALWADQVTRLTLRLVVQGPMADEFDGISYREDLDLLVADTATALSDLYADLLATLPSNSGDALAQWQSWAPLLGAMADGMRRFDANIVRADYIAAQLLSAMDGIAQPLSFETLAGALGIANLRIGTNSNETLARGGAEGAAVYLSNGGTDTLNGGTGQDVYLFGRQIGAVTINDDEPNPAGDRIRFAFLNPTDVTMARSGNDLLITVTATGETVRVPGQFAPVVPLGSDVLLSSNKGVEEIQFADGTVYEIPEIMSAVGKGTSGNDHMVGTMHSDVFLGGLGNDRLEGGDDADLYVINGGEGQDVIHDQQTTPLLRAADLVIFGDDIAPDDLSFSRAGSGGDDLVISIGSSGQSLLIEGQFAYTVLGYNDKLAPNSRIEAFGFRHYGDGWSNRDLQQKMIAAASTSGNDTILGFGDNDLFGTSAGNDLMIGLDGADHYQWGLGSGNDVIDEQARFVDVKVGLAGLSLVDEADTILFGSGLTLGAVTFTRPTAAPDLVITLVATGETLTIVNQFDGFQTGPLGAQWLDRIEWFEFANGTRISWQDALADVTSGGTGDDSLWGDLFADRMDGGAGNDTLTGHGYGDTYVFQLGYGDDTIVDANEDILGPGFVTVDATPDILEFGAGIAPGDLGFVRDGADLILNVGTGGDSVTLKGQDDYFHSGVFGALSYNRIEEVRFANGTVWTWAQLNSQVLQAATTSGNDTIIGFTMADRFEASAGNDILRGGDSGDTYVFGYGSGHDIVRESVSNVLYGDEDVVEFGAGVTTADVQLTHSGDDLVITLISTGETLTIEGEFSYQAFYTWTDVEKLRFANGTEWTKDQVIAQFLIGTAGADHLIGFSSDDSMNGNAGNDILEGRDGSDTYHFGRGSGNEIVRESLGNTNLSENDRLLFGAGVLPTDVTFARDGNDLVVTIIDTGETLRIEGQYNFTNWFAWNDIETFEFANGTLRTHIEIAQSLLGGTSGNDHLVGTFQSDILDGGAGNDILEGGDGADRYFFSLGSGQDEIRESLSNANLSEDDLLTFGAGITLANLEFERDGNDLIISVAGTTDSVTITGEFNYSSWFTWQDIDRFILGDGTALTKEQVQQIILTPTSGNDHMVGFMTGDTLDGGAGNDTLEGGDGADTYLFGRGYGQDVIHENVHDANLSDWDTIGFGTNIVLSDLRFTRSGNSLIIGIVGATDTMTVVDHWVTITEQSSAGWHDIENFLLAGGTALTARDVDLLYIAQAKTSGDDVIQGTIFADTIEGGDGNDTLRGGNADDSLDGGSGNDRLEGGAGTDSYFYGLGDDTIVEVQDGSVNRIRLAAGIDAADLIVTGNPADAAAMRITFDGRAGSIDVLGQWSATAANIAIQAIDFADGTHWSTADLAAAFVASQKTSGNETIYGTALADIMDGGAGADSLIGGLGDDVYRFGLGSGVDTILDQGPQYWWGYESGGNDRIDLGVGIATADVEVYQQNGTDLVIQITGTTDKLVLSGAINDATKRIEEVRFADGTSWNWTTLLAATLLGTSANDTISAGGTPSTIGGKGGNDTLYGSGGADVIIGGTGNDGLYGNTGNDTYRFARGDGVDTILDRGDQQWWGFPDGGVDRIEFAAGIAPTDIQVLQLNGDDLALQIVGTSDRIVISGGLGDSVRRIETVAFAGGTVWTYADMLTLATTPTAGNDTIWAGDTAWTLSGAAGNDTLHGSVNADILIGGTGNDTLYGGKGDDAYRFTWGDGADTILDRGWQQWWGFESGGTDRIELGAGVVPGDVALFTTNGGADLVLTLNGSDDSVTILGGTVDASKIEEVRFAGGTVWNYADLSARIAGSFTAGADSISGTAGDDDRRGGGGNDTIGGLDGNDRIGGDAGDDMLDGGAGNDFAFGGAGNDQIKGSAGDDRLAGGAGNDSLFGGGGEDVAIFTGAIADYQISVAGNVVTVTGGGDGTDLLTGIEHLQFSDGTIDAPAMTSGLAGLAFFVPMANPVSHVIGYATDLGGGTYRLTPAVNSRIGAIWGSADLANDIIWSARLNFGTNDGGDGIGFALANVSQLTTQTLGSYGVEFNGTFGIRFATWSNWWEGNPGVDFSQFLLNGNLSGSQTSFGPYLPIGELEGGAWHDLTVAWDAETKTLTYTLNGQFTQSKVYDVSANLLGGGTVASFGFGASTGGLNNDQRIELKSVMTASEDASVDDQASAGTLITRLVASNTNPGDTISYAIVDSAGQPATSSLFEIVGGDQIVVKSGAQLGVLVGTTADLWILVSNSSGETLLQDLSISII